MRVIKRYPNRKLYDTEAKRYVALDNVTDLVRQGEKIYVMDNATGEDVTTLVLTQIVMELEKRQSGSVPASVLTGFIQASGDTLSALRRTLFSPLELLRQVDDEIERRIATLVTRGELAEEEGRKLVEQLVARGRQLQSALDPKEGELERALNRQTLPTRTDLRLLIDQVDAISEELDSLGPNARRG